MIQASKFNAGQYKISISEKIETKENLKRIEDIYGNILESIHEAAEGALGNQEKRKNSKDE